MKTVRSLFLGTLAALSVGAGGSFLAQPASATLFDQAEVDQSRFVAIASPVAGGSLYRLIILEQISNSRACWRESGNVVEPLLLSFDFTGICGRNPDSNGYSVRVAGQDLGLQYSLRIRRSGSNLVLYAEPMNRSRGPALEIGRASTIADGPVRVNLNPGWRFTKRVFNGQQLGHIYLTNDQPLNTLIAAASRPTAPLWRDDDLPPVSARPPGPLPRSANSGRSIEIPVPAPDTNGSWNSASNGTWNSNGNWNSNNSWNSNESRSNETPVPIRPVVRGDGVALPPPPRTNRPDQVGVLPVPSMPPTPRGQTPPGMPSVSVNRTPNFGSSSSSPWSSGTGPTTPTQLASQLGFSYRVIVPSTAPDVQSRLLSVAPDAFRTIIDGQVVMQAGLFRQLSDAQAFQATLTSQNLPARVVPVNR
ncbi:MAG TPA: DUF3747 domain-containing protein [Synechococcales cyanobacterium M55_K2018_004]|nr:DUF3747 domain-containing protein [Synechococcales cyanobacterium M55_K2018_004]